MEGPGKPAQDGRGSGPSMLSAGPTAPWACPHAARPHSSLTLRCRQARSTIQGQSQLSGWGGRFPFLQSSQVKLQSGPKVLSRQTGDGLREEPQSLAPGPGPYQKGTHGILGPCRSHVGERRQGGHTGAERALSGQPGSAPDTGQTEQASWLL